MSEYEAAKAKYIDESLLVTDRACPEYARRNVENATAMYQAADAELARLREAITYAHDVFAGYVHGRPTSLGVDEAMKRLKALKSNDS